MGKKNEGVGKDEVGVVGQGEAEMRCQDRERQKETERERQRHRGSGRLCATAGPLFSGEEIQASSEHSWGAENLPTLGYGPAEQSVGWEMPAKLQGILMLQTSPSPLCLEASPQGSAGQLLEIFPQHPYFSLLLQSDSGDLAPRPFATLFPSLDPW